MSVRSGVEKERQGMQSISSPLNMDICELIMQYAMQELQLWSNETRVVSYLFEQRQQSNFDHYDRFKESRIVAVAIIQVEPNLFPCTCQ